jgi:phosphoribosylformylglycinamidine cyclo-ligase
MRYEKLSYESTGVSIVNGDMFVDYIKKVNTQDDNTFGGIGGFCSLYRNPSYKSQLIASCTDGVGTKLLLADELRQYGFLESIGIDLVAMVVNDIITCGAMPLFLLDYYATPSLSIEKDNFERSKEIINGIIKGCALSNCFLLGGETAEMPDVYTKGKFDLAAFAVGLVEEKDVRGAHKVNAGDVVIGISSSGPHSNGYTLLRHIYKKFDWENNPVIRNGIMKPTRLYVLLVKQLLTGLYGNSIHAMAHITGGGLESNTIRVIPETMKLSIDWTSWKRPDIFDDIQRRAHLEETELRSVFNCGIGYTLIVDKKDAEKIKDQINLMGYYNWIIGKVEEK